MRFHFHSLHGIWTELKSTCFRYPVECLVSIVGFLLAFSFIDTISYNDAEHNYSFYVKSMMGCSWALALSLAITTFYEVKLVSNIFRFIGYIISIIFVIAYFYLSPPIDDWSEIYLLRFATLFIGFHLLVSISTYLANSNILMFWEFNKALFIRFINAVAYSVVLFIGLSIAFVSINQLLNIEIREKAYFRLFAFIATIFNTFFFLSGIPKPLQNLAFGTDYPKELRVFVQYVLIPLVVVYLSILYLYIFKISMESNLPKGWVTYLVVCFSVFGILSLLLLFPLRFNQQLTWLRGYWKWFFRALIPLIILLWVAIYTRIINYGITELRYMVLLIAIWLTGITIFYNFFKRSHIQWIPISLCFLTIMSAFGPWGFEAVSTKSQKNRFITLAKKLQLWEDNQLKKGKIDSVNTNLGSELFMVASYFFETRKTATLFSMLPDSLVNELKDTNNSYYDSRNLFAVYYNLNTNMPSNSETTFWVYYTNKVNNSKAKYVSGFNYYKEFHISFNEGITQQNICTVDPRVEVHYKDPHEFTFWVDSKKCNVVDLKNFNKKNAKPPYQIKMESDSLTFDFTCADQKKVRIILNNYSFYVPGVILDKGIRNVNMDGEIMWE